MLQLFQSIFGAGRRDTSSHPAELIARATERVVDGTDPRLRARPGYRKTLRPAVTHAVDHVMALVDGLPAVLELNPQYYGTDPELTAFFASVEHLGEVLERDATLKQWRRSREGELSGQVVMLLLMTLTERKVLGFGLEGDVLRGDVVQTLVGFGEHQLVDPNAAEDETRRLLKRRAFDHLLALALGRMASATAERGNLEREGALLRRKQKALAAGNWGFFDESGNDMPADPQTLQSRLEEIESQLSAPRSGNGLLNANLDIVMDVLTHAEDNLWSASLSLIVDRMGVKQTQATALAPEINVTTLQDSAGRSLIARLVRIDRNALPAERDLLREAERYLR